MLPAAGYQRVKLWLAHAEACSTTNLTSRNFSARQLPAEQNCWEAGTAFLHVNNAAAFQDQLSGSRSVWCPKATFALLLPPSLPVARSHGLELKEFRDAIQERDDTRVKDSHRLCCKQDLEQTLNGQPQCWV